MKIFRKITDRLAMLYSLPIALSFIQFVTAQLEIKDSNLNQNFKKKKKKQTNKKANVALNRSTGNEVYSDSFAQICKCLFFYLWWL